MNLSHEAEKTHATYQDFLREYYPHCDNFFLPDFIDWFKEDSHIDAFEIKRAWKRHILRNKKEKKESAFNFYIHIPFCQNRCSYCLYYSRPISGRETDGYMDWLSGQFDFFGDTFKGEKFNNLYIGGGTPSILSNRQIERLLKSLFSRFSFKKNGERSFECNPSSISPAKLKILKKFGINRVSFGVQSLDKKVLALANRGYQKYASVKEAITCAKSKGFEVNADLMVGLKESGLEDIMKSFLKLANLRPDSITIYPYKPRGGQLEKYLEEDFDVYADANAREIESIYKIIKANEKQLGYQIYARDKFEFRPSAGMFLPRIGSRKPGDLYNFFYKKPSSLFSLGPKANSHIFNSMHCHHIERDGKYSKFEPGKKNFWAIKYNLKDEMRYFLLHKLAGSLGFSRIEFKKYFGSEFGDNFKKELSLLKKIKDVRIKKEFIFFPASRFKRFACAMMLFDRNIVTKTIKKTRK